MEPEQNLASYEKIDARLKRSERMIWLIGLCWLLTISLAVIEFLWKTHRAQTVSEGIRVRQLVVVDGNDKERIVIAAPLPDPFIAGRQAKRRTAVSAGIQFKDPDGTERGGIASEADGSFMFGIDDEHGKERAHLYYIPKRGSGVYLQGENGNQALSLLNPPGLVDMPKLEITDPAGNVKATFAPKK